MEELESIDQYLREKCAEVRKVTHRSISIDRDPQGSKMNAMRFDNVVVQHHRGIRWRSTCGEFKWCNVRSGDLRGGTPGGWGGATELSGRPPLPAPLQRRAEAPSPNKSSLRSSMQVRSTTFCHDLIDSSARRLRSSQAGVLVRGKQMKRIDIQHAFITTDVNTL